MSSIAWIVAIENYAGSELDIPRRVGAWALEFAELMLSRGVERVVLSDSLHNAPAYTERLRELEARGVARTTADRAGLENALDRLAQDAADFAADTLFLYWVGHGIMAPSRQLLCADSRSLSALRSIAADSLLTRLRAPEFPRLQIGFFECCAQWVAAAPARLDLGGDGSTITRQFFYHAASAGEFASGSSEVGFSSTVLAQLRASAAFPPQPDILFDRLKAALGMLPLETRPFLQRTYESGDVWSNGDPARRDDTFDAARVAGLEYSEFDSLWRCVRREALQPLELARAYGRCELPHLFERLRIASPGNLTPDLLERGARDLELEQAFEPLCRHLRLYVADWLAIYNRVVEEDGLGKTERVDGLPGMLLRVLDQARDEFALRSFLKMLELAARRAEDRSSQGVVALREACARHPRLRHHYAGLMESLRVAKDDLFLLLAIEWDAATRAASLSDAWIFPDCKGGFDRRDPAPSGKLAEQVNAVVERTIAEFPERPLRIELLAPNDLLCAPRALLELVDAELDTCTWLEAYHPITLRWSNRMKGVDEKYRPGTWKAAGRAARTAAEAAESLSCTWHPDPPDPARSLIGLTFPGPCPSDPQRNRRRFFDELLQGNPYMCWPRNALDDLERFKRSAAELLRRSRLKTLPADLRACRSDSALSDLLLLIDEPHRNPYDHQNHLVETPQRGTS